MLNFRFVPFFQIKRSLLLNVHRKANTAASCHSEETAHVFRLLYVRIMERLDVFEDTERTITNFFLLFVSGIFRNCHLVENEDATTLT